LAIAKRSGEKARQEHGSPMKLKRPTTVLHKLGFAHSAEVWKNGELVGGLYGVRIGKIFFGESMFTKQSNASKYAFIKLVEHLKNDGVELIDCQVYTEHLESWVPR
jgi:leucyl/phenylalanyl-tRNA--protein transferase